MLNVGFMPMGVPGVFPLVAADFNGDGVADVAGQVPNYLMIGVSLSNGDGTFQPAFTRPSSAPTQLLAADFDGDGRPDLIAGGRTFFRGNGDGTLADPVDIPLAADATGWAAVDYNRDGKADLAISDSARNLRVLTSNGIGFVPGPVIQVGAACRVYGAALSHVGGDSSVVALQAIAPSPDLRIRVARVEADGSVAIGALIDSGGAPLQAFADLDGDGEADLVWARDGLRIAHSLGRGFFEPDRLAFEGGSVLAVGDLDRDGIADLAVAGVVNHDRHMDASVVFGVGDGMFNVNFGNPLAVFHDETPRAVVGPFLLNGGMGVLVVSSLTVQGFSTTPAPSIVALSGLLDPIGSPQSVSLLATGISGPRPIRTTLFYLDSNNNGRLDSGDQAVGSVEGNAGMAMLSAAHGVPGHNRWFAIAGDTGYVYSTPVSFDADLWFSIFYPEGWRNDTTINEYVPLVNPNDTQASYRIVARYEVGDRDQVIAAGVLAPHSRAGVTISERNYPESALVRLNVGYALDVQSDIPIGATLSHYDNFGASSGGAANGEAFGDATSLFWAFADVSTRSFDFLLFFNPLGHDATITMTFRGGVNTFVITRAVAALRRSGVALRDAGLDPDSDYSVLISADSPIVAAMSRYTAEGTGFSSLGQTAFSSTIAPLVEFRPGVTNRIVLFNASDTGADVTILSRYQASDIADTTRMFHLTPGLRLVVDPGDHAPPEATRATLRITGAVYLQVESIDTVRGDSVAAAPANTIAATWAFADGFLDRNTAGAVGFETISIYNPAAAAQTATIRYLFTDGFSITRTVNIDPGRTAHIDLHLDQELINHANLNFFSTIITGTSPLIAAMTHWDLFQGGGWETLGTPIGATGPL